MADGLASPLRASEQEQMEQEIRAELWKVLESSDLESITSKEVGKGLGLRCLQDSAALSLAQLLLWTAPRGPS